MIHVLDQNKPNFLFPISFSKTIKISELIHVDIWGPYKKATINEEHFSYQLLMTIVEEFGFI